MKILKLILTVVCVISVSITLYAQEGSIVGVVNDASTKNPIYYAGVTLMRAQDTILVKGVMTDKDGAFSIENVVPGNYILKVMFVGYENWYSQLLNVTNQKIQLDNINLQLSAQALKAAEVVYVKPLFEEKFGKTIMNVESQPTAASDNVLELLRKMPTVMVDHKDNISIQGSMGVTILIDDKRTYLSGEDLVSMLKSMPANSVDRIEVIKNPSARYDAEGTGGIINIVMKKNLNRGINGSVFSMGGYSGSAYVNAGFNLNARFNKWVLTAGYNYNFWQGKNGNRMENITPTSENINRMTTNEKDNELWNNKSFWQGHNVNFGADYTINTKNNIGFSYRGSFNDAEGSTNQFTRIYNKSIADSSYKVIPDSSYRSFSLAKDNGYNNTFNFDYKHTFDTTGKVLYLDITYSRNDRTSHSDDAVRYYYGEFSGNFYQSYLQSSILNPGIMQVLTTKLDYEHPFTEQLKLEMGLKSSFAFNNIKNNNFKNAQFILEQSNHFKYNENIDAAYLMLTTSPTEKLNMQIGIRTELTYWQSLLVTTGEKNKQFYCDVFPSFQIDYKLPKDNSLSLSYKNRIYRPNYRQLNPFMYIEPYEINTGNPNLKPQYSHDIELGYSWRYMLFLSLSYNYIKDATGDMLFTDLVTNQRIKRPENMGKQHNFGASLYTRIPIGKWWVMIYSINGNIGQNTFDYETKSVTKMIYSTSLWTSQVFTFLKNYTIEVSAWGMPPQEQAFGHVKGAIHVNAGFKALLLKQSLTIGLNITDIFNGGYWREENVYPNGTVMNSQWRWPSRGVYLNISYRFGKQDIQFRQRTATNEEIDRMGGNNENSGSNKSNRN